ncbi:MAG: 3-methyladenine DNA glycosylase [Gammaproteobacteria bacterium]|nr:DNA-3-methyladenine glycosylase I [Pseudomonadota bacterium]PCH65084.1 MAG: 3-methyladenine DNA glycosylase [Gammaproteobacteria bacterium]
MKKFETIYQRAVERIGSEKNLKTLLPDNLKTNNALIAITDDRYLAEMTRSVFKAGFVWRVIDSKWAGFEEAFWQFNVDRCAWMSPEDIDALVSDVRIIRNHQKIVTVLANAAMMLEIRESHDSFGQFIADWPSADFVGLLQFLHKNGSRLGPRTCQYFLRSMGKDGFILATDGVAALIDAGVVDKYPNSKRDIQSVQDAFNEWQQQSELSLAQISKVLAFSVGAA